MRTIVKTVQKANSTLRSAFFVLLFWTLLLFLFISSFSLTMQYEFMTESLDGGGNKYRLVDSNNSPVAFSKALSHLSDKTSEITNKFVKVINHQSKIFIPADIFFIMQDIEIRTTSSVFLRVSSYFSRLSSYYSVRICDFTSSDARGCRC